MNEETRDMLRKRMASWKATPARYFAPGIGPEEVIDLFIEIACGNCEYMCNDTHCGIREQSR